MKQRFTVEIEVDSDEHPEKVKDRIRKSTFFFKNPGIRYARVNWIEEAQPTRVADDRETLGYLISDLIYNFFGNR